MTWLALAAWFAAAAQAQSGPAPAASISYVASVKPNNSPGALRFTEYYPGGRLVATEATVSGLLRLAYRIQDYQLVGAPAWLTSKRYDIAAKVDSSPPPSQQEFLQVLLADRFKLMARRETREMPRFALVLARSDRHTGPQLIPSNFDCAAYQASPHPPPEPGRTPNCATRINAGALSGKSITMTQLATSLAPFVNRFTTDRTGLTGAFDVELAWTPSVGQTYLPAQTPNLTDPVSIFTAIQEQLGLKLAPDRGPVDVLVIDRVEEPSEN